MLMGQKDDEDAVQHSPSSGGRGRSAFGQSANSGGTSLLDAHSYMHIPREECELLYRQISATRATQAIEVGMAFGISTLCLCDALCRNTPLQAGKRPHLVVMDPFQHGSIWQGVGLEHVQSADFGDIVEFKERPSHAVLPELVAKGYRIQFRVHRWLPHVRLCTD